MEGPTDMHDRSDHDFMRVALRLAERARRNDEVPVGAVIVHDGRAIAEAHNLREQLQDPTAHAETIAIRIAAGALGTWRLNRCTMYVTLEPCAMCAGALVLARIDRLVYGADDPKAGACGSVLNVLDNPRLNHRVEVVRGVLGPECGQVLTAFFQGRRAIGRK